MGAWAIATVLAIAWVSPAAAADAGDDFSNNLFTDLAPYAMPCDLATFEFEGDANCVHPGS